MSHEPETQKCSLPLLLAKYMNKDIGKELNVTGLKNYILSECLGKGGFGEIYLLKDKKSDKSFALKVIDFKNEGDRTKFNKEKETYELFMTNKEACVKEFINCYLGIYKTDKYGLILMNYFQSDLQKTMSGTSFSKLITENKNNLGKFIRWVKELIAAVSYMHANNIAHGDIKPDNILVNADSTLAITDFDTICSKVQCQIPASVTNYYASPDLDETTTIKFGQTGQPVHKDIVQRSDWWAVCIIVLELWFGRDKTIQRFPAMISDFVNEVRKENGNVYNQISSLISNELPQSRLPPAEQHAVFTILFASYQLLKKIGLKSSSINNDINFYIKTVNEQPNFSSQTSVKQKGGSDDDYYKMKYFKYKSKYLRIRKRN